MRSLKRILLVAAVAASGACGRANGTTEPVTEIDLRVELGTVEVPLARLGTIRVGPDEPLTGTGFLSGERAELAAATLDDPAAVTRLVDGPATSGACTEIYGGPDVAHVVGTIGGAAVDTVVDRANGCGIADWDLLADLLGPPLWQDDGEGTYGDAGHPITLPLGEPFEVRLESNPSTGYQWQLEITGSAVEVVGDRYEEPDSDLVGAAGHQVFELRVAEPGSSVLALSYVRSFEPDVEPIDQRELAVEIAPD